MKNIIIVLVMLSMLLIFVPNVGDITEELSFNKMFKDLNTEGVTFSEFKGELQYGDSYDNDTSELSYHSSMPENVRELNTEILNASDKYSNMQPNMHSMGKYRKYYMIALTIQEWGRKPAGSEQVIASIDMTPEVYNSNNGALKQYWHKQLFGLGGYNSSGVYKGPLQTSEGFIKNTGIIPGDMGVIGMPEGTRRYDKDVGSASKGDRWNLYDSFNITAQSYNRKLPQGLTTPYEAIALYAMFHNFGGSVAQTTGLDTIKGGSSWSEQMSPGFAQAWCKIVAQEKYVSKYSKELKELAPLGKSNGTTAIVKKWHEEAWEEFKRVNPQLMSQYKDNKKNNREKTRFPIEVMLYNILVEGRYTGQW